MASSAPVAGPATERRPAVRAGLAIRRIGDEAVVWSDLRPAPALLDPVATVMIDVVDGYATPSELTADVEDALGIDHYAAWAQVKRVLQLFDDAGMLTSSVPEQPVVDVRPLLPEPDW